MAWKWKPTELQVDAICVCTLMLLLRYTHTHTGTHTGSGTHTHRESVTPTQGTQIKWNTEAQAGQGAGRRVRGKGIECRPCNLQLLPQSIAASCHHPPAPLDRGLHSDRGRRWAFVFCFWFLGVRVGLFRPTSIAKKLWAGRSWSASSPARPRMYATVHWEKIRGLNYRIAWKSSKEIRE